MSCDDRPWLNQWLCCLRMSMCFTYGFVDEFIMVYWKVLILRASIGVDGD